MAMIFDGLTKRLLNSGSSADYLSDPSRYAVDPELPSKVPMKYLKVVSGQKEFKGETITTGIVYEMTQQEKEAEDAALLAKTLPDPKYMVRTFDTDKKLLKEEWFQIDNLDGTYSKKAKDFVYNYVADRMMSRVETSYFYDGTVATSAMYIYYTGSGETEISKRV